MAQPPAARHPPAGDPRGRSVVARAGVLPVMAHLTDRDLTIIDWLDRHGVFTTGQLTAAFFTAASTATHRLLKLRSLDLIDRFHRPSPGGGFGPWHWVVGTAGAALAAAGRGQPPPAAKALRERHARLARDPQLAHHLAANQFFIDLYRHTRHHPDAALLRWWSTRDTATAYHQRIHPDGHALWREQTRHGPVTIGLFLEYDRGTERPIRRLADKLAAYDELAADGGPAYPVLFVLPSGERERDLHDGLAGRAGRLVPVATTFRPPADGGTPAGPIWALVGDPRPRCRLVELPSSHGRRDSVYNATFRDLDVGT